MFLPEVSVVTVNESSHKFLDRIEAAENLRMVSGFSKAIQTNACVPTAGAAMQMYVCECMEAERESKTLCGRRQLC